MSMELSFTRRIIQVGDSLAATIPREVVDGLKLKAGDLVDFKVKKLE